MAVDRPTFSESWYRVTAMRPRLRSTVQTYRQHYRGQMWHVLRDPSNNQFFRLNDAAYHFVGLLDGQRMVQDAWEICNRDLGDDAPTQVEVVQLLGQLYTSNLLAAELPADAAGMFDRYKKRVRREVGGYFKNLLFIRVPLIDPDVFLDRWVRVFGLAFTKIGFVAWIILIGIGFWSLSGQAANLTRQAGQVLDPDNLIFLYLSFAFIKVFHEFGHGFACKKFGRDTQSGGEVHTMGIMFLVFMPVPYVDASSSWALRSKWQRITIAAAGIYIELAVAAIAAVVWSRTSEGTAIHAMAHNMMLIASVSTLVFNGNPLLRFDAYYMLSDALEIPNLAQRSKEYIYYLVKRYAYKVERARTPAHTEGERYWLVSYGVASSIYRVFISVRILLFVADKLFFVGALLAISALFAWVIMPLGKWMNYLATSPDLMRSRSRAVGLTGGAFVVFFVGIGLIPVDEHDRAEAVVEPQQMAIVFMREDGFIQSTLASDTHVEPGDHPLVVATNPALEAERDQKVAELAWFEAQQREALANEDTAIVQVLNNAIQYQKYDLKDIEERIATLNLRAPIVGQWIAPNIEYMQGAFLRRGDQVDKAGLVADLDSLFIRAVADQELGPRIKTEVGEDSVVEIRVKGRPDLMFYGKIRAVNPAGQERLPSQALGYAVGGTVQTAMDDPEGTRTAEQFFEVHIDRLEDDEGRVPPLFSGQRVMVRFKLPSRPLAAQWWHQIRQLVQRRFFM